MKAEQKGPGSSAQRHHYWIMSTEAVFVALPSGVTLASSTTPRNLGVLFHQSLDAHVWPVSRLAFCRLCDRCDSERLVRVFTSSSIAG